MAPYDSFVVVVVHMSAECKMRRMGPHFITLGVSPCVAGESKEPSVGLLASSLLCPTPQTLFLSQCLILSCTVAPLGCTLYCICSTAPVSKHINLLGQTPSRSDQEPINRPRRQAAMLSSSHYTINVTLHYFIQCIRATCRGVDRTGAMGWAEKPCFSF